MAKRREITDAEALTALGDAATRAIFRAPESLLVHFDSEKRETACWRLAHCIIKQLDGDGWREGRGAKDCPGLDVAIAKGIGRAEHRILIALPEARRADGRVLDGVGAHIGTSIFTAMQEYGARLKRRG